MSDAANPADVQAQAQEWPLWEVFVRSKAGLDHKHCVTVVVDVGHFQANICRTRCK